MKPRLTQVPRNPQLTLRLESRVADEFAAHWRDGATFAYLGATRIVCIDTPYTKATLEANTLHLPFPPGVTPRQIQDGVEAWLRQQAGELIAACLARESQRIGCAAPAWSYTFSARAPWVQHHEDGSLRFNWRLIEQPREILEGVIATALATLPGAETTTDLWDAQAT